MRIPYRYKLLLKKLLRFLLIVAAVAVVVGIVSLIYFESLMVYDRDGAHLVLSPTEMQSSAPMQQESRPVIDNPSIIYDEAVTAKVQIADLGGYYITTEMLQDPQRVLDEIKALPQPCAVMIELKSIYGSFYYSSKLPEVPIASIETKIVDEMIAYLKDNGFYMIGVIPAFSDPAFALENQSCGLPLSSGALWMDSNGCYWLDPANSAVTAYLLQISRELVSLGFHEVTFSSFLFPASESIVYNSDLTPLDALKKAVEELTVFFANSETTISFISEASDFPVSSITGRLYIPDVDGARVEMYRQMYRNEKNLLELVFMANSKDTRFEGTALLRPLLTE